MVERVKFAGAEDQPVLIEVSVDVGPGAECEEPKILYFCERGP